MERYIWSDLKSTQQIGAYAEYFVKMELTMHGFEVYSSEVDNRGIDFVARYGNRSFIEVQVKSLRLRNNTGYVFMQKTKFELGPNSFLALVLFVDGKPPDLYLIPSVVWETPTSLFVSHDYGAEGQTSEPEWGLNISHRNMAELERFQFEASLTKLYAENADASGETI